MARSALAASTAPAAAAPPQPQPELTAQSILGGLVVAAVLAAAYPFAVLKLGFGFDASMVSAFLGAVFLSVVARATRGANRLQNNIIQTMAGSATATAFMCVVMAAFAYLTSNWGLDVGFNPAWWQVLAWLTCSGCIGVLFVTRFRRFFLDHPRMKFASGVAAAVVIEALDRVSDNTEAAKESVGRTRSLGAFGLIGALVAVGRDLLKWLGQFTLSKGYRVAIGFDALSFGTGLLLTANVGLSYMVGAVILWSAGDSVIRYAALDASHGQLKAAVLWFMWPASAFMITASITSLLINTSRARQRTQAVPASSDATPHPTEEDLPLRVVVGGTLALSVILVTVQYLSFGVSPVKTLAAVAAQLVLILAGVWVLGETNWGPVSLMANGAQLVFGLVWRHDVRGNLIAAGMAGDGNAQAEQVMQTYKTGRLLGATPKAMAIAQLIGVPIGALAVAVVFPLLVRTYGIGPQGKLSAPTGLKLANMAVLIDQGLDAFPKGALTASAVAVVLGILFEVIRNSGSRFRGWVPSPAALGFGLILQPAVSLMLGFGAIAAWVWSRRSPATFERYHQTVAAGLIVGEALIAGIVLPVFTALGWTTV